MARTLLLTLLFCALIASSASAGEFVDVVKNRDWPPTTDFSLTSDPCAQGQCAFTARLTFRHDGKVLGRIPLQSPAQEGGNWDTKRYGHIEDTNQAQFFWNCDTPGEHKWSAKIWKIENGERTDYPAETGTWKQPGCSNGTPRKVSRATAESTVQEKVIFGDRQLEDTSCKRREKVGRWICTVSWSNEARSCTDKQSLFFYTRKIFFRRFSKVSSFRESRSCTPNGA